NAESSRNCAQCHARAAYERFQQHIGRACAKPIATGCRVKPGFNARFSRFYLAGDSLADAPFGPESDQRGLRTLSILRLERRLQRPQLVSIHSDPASPDLIGPVKWNQEAATVSAFLPVGLMFWFTRKRLPGSYLFLMATSRS